MREGDRVVGVRAANPAGQERVFRASLVVGADGRHSAVAHQVQAEEYLAYDAPRAMYWGTGTRPHSGEPIPPIDSGCISRIPMVTFA